LNDMWRRAALGAVVLAGLAGAAAGPATAQRMIATKDPAHPRIKYADSLVSLNDRCIVRQGGLNAMYKPVYVNGKPIGFC
jgi:hypothetical protein